MYRQKISKLRFLIFFSDLSQSEVYTNSDGEERQPLLFNAVTNSLQRASSDTATEQQTSYCWRWYMLAVVAVLNLSNGMVSLVLCLLSSSLIYTTADEAVAYMFYRCFFVFFVFFLFFSVHKKYETTVLGNG